MHIAGESAHRPSAARPLLTAVIVTVAVTALSYGVPEAHAATAVGAAFFLATYALVLRSTEPETVQNHGLSLAGLFEPGALDFRRIMREGARATGWALLVSAIVFPPFWVGWRVWWHPVRGFSAAVLPDVDLWLGQLLVIALPEEAFYRGYLQSELDQSWPTRWRVLGADLGPGILATSALFALGHLATEVNPARLGVFFPSLLFGWLRARTGGIGAAVAFHAFSNLFASYLARSYGLSH